ncbi:hypothetical protein [Agromyces archimandritae]|uniref:Uncharacterized protein n=1 Tax=Agromyces archimandritae TaxID=2781962 RepID=A0A975FLH2_9MICO|nr:hypothetical protein [Agromyces archimandritae]QTX04124.1 hypothetical protein G127AT_12595 [Agromyces archimandritae]
MTYEPPARHRRYRFRDTELAQWLFILGLALLALGMAAVAAWLMTEAIR